MKKRIGQEEEEVFTFPGVLPKERKNWFSRRMAEEYHFFLKTIENIEDYEDWFQILINASPYDIVHLHINSGGGDLSIATQLISHITNSSATVIGCVEGDCSSASTLIFFKCDAWEISDHTTFLFHTYKTGLMGKGVDLQDSIDFNKKWWQKFVLDCYTGILTETEIQALLNGKEIYLLGDEVTSRLEAKVLKMKEQAEKELEEPKLKKARTKK